MLVDDVSRGTSFGAFCGFTQERLEMGFLIWHGWRIEGKKFAVLSTCWHRPNCKLLMFHFMPFWAGWNETGPPSVECWSFHSISLMTIREVSIGNSSWKGLKLAQTRLPCRKTIFHESRRKLKFMSFDVPASRDALNWSQLREPARSGILSSAKGFYLRTRRPV